MKQVWFFHGGNSFSDYNTYLNDLKQKTIDYEKLKPKQRWSQWLSSNLYDADFLMPNMPNSENAQYIEWKMMFEKLIPLFSDDIHLIGHSLGAMFLVKYLQDNTLPKKLNQLILVAPAYDGNSREDLGSFTISSTENVIKRSDTVHLFHSQDDPVVPFEELSKYQKDMPKAIIHTFTDRGHFLNPEFPEILALLQK